MLSLLAFGYDTLFKPREKCCTLVVKEIDSMIAEYDSKTCRVKLERSAFFLGHCVYSSKDTRMNLITEEVNKLFLLGEDKEQRLKTVIKNVLISFKRVVLLEKDTVFAIQVQKILQCLIAILNSYKLDFDSIDDDNFLYQEKIFCVPCDEYLHGATRCEQSIHVPNPDSTNFLHPHTCYFMILKAKFCKALRKLFPFDFRDFDQFLAEMRNEQYQFIFMVKPSKEIKQTKHNTEYSEQCCTANPITTAERNSYFKNKFLK
ncbi:hypothetical protein TUBRATIS_20160 [Tubulinosema ratisbonensis]|uniref:Uncharacterized protein n=1 Tax=Tubulinosema ratisbonensis TaxID=291195 RepID=A0A437AKB2_9MICR|nr:hypothetical protein TUBRATIS_20160 [Tubulinosema ratisbonensis]